MKQAILYRTIDGIWNALFLADSTVKFGGQPHEKAMDIAKKLAAEYPDTQIGIRSRDVGPSCRLIYGPVIWLTKEATAA
jgi:hypothetical protein